MNETVIRLASLSVIGCLWFAACAGSSGKMGSRLDETEAELREEIDSLKRAVEASYDREQAIAGRLRLAEVRSVELGEQLERQRLDLDSLRRHLNPPGHNDGAPISDAARFDVSRAYQSARDSHSERQYQAALEKYAKILSLAPASKLADNAQYWMGECYYGLGKFRRAQSEFAKVFDYPKTEKADDAQLMIARCHLALGEEDEALAAFRKLLDEYPESEYVTAARKETRYLRGP